MRADGELVGVASKAGENSELYDNHLFVSKDDAQTFALSACPIDPTLGVEPRGRAIRPVASTSPAREATATRERPDFSPRTTAGMFRGPRGSSISPGGETVPIIVAGVDPKNADRVYVRTTGFRRGSRTTPRHRRCGQDLEEGLRCDDADPRRGALGGRQARVCREFAKESLRVPPTPSHSRRAPRARRNALLRTATPSGRARPSEAASSLASREAVAEASTPNCISTRSRARSNVRPRATLARSAVLRSRQPRKPSRPPRDRRQTSQPFSVQPPADGLSGPGARVAALPRSRGSRWLVSLVTTSSSVFAVVERRVELLLSSAKRRPQARAKRSPRRRARWSDQCVGPFA